MEEKIKKAREMLRKLESDRSEVPYNKAKRFFVIQKSLAEIKKD